MPRLRQFNRHRLFVFVVSIFLSRTEAARPSQNVSKQNQAMTFTPHDADCRVYSFPLLYGGCALCVRVSCVRVSLCPCVRVSVCLRVRVSACPCIRVSACPRVRKFAHPSVRPSVLPSVRPSVRPSIRPSVRPSVSIWFNCVLLGQHTSDHQYFDR